MLCSWWKWKFLGQFSSGQSYRLFLSYIAVMGQTTSNGHTKWTKKFPPYQFSMQWSQFSHLQMDAVTFLQNIWTFNPYMVQQPKSISSSAQQSLHCKSLKSSTHLPHPSRQQSLLAPPWAHKISQTSVFPWNSGMKSVNCTVEYIRAGITMTLATQLFPISCATLYSSIQQSPNFEQSAAPSWQTNWQPPGFNKWQTRCLNRNSTSASQSQRTCEAI